MRWFHAKYSKGQLKIQEMAFVLIGIMVFFAMVFVFYAAIRGTSLSKEVQEIKEDEANEVVKKIVSSPEFSWGGCSNCLDMDKAFFLKDRKGYNGFWKLGYLRIERVYPLFGNGECTPSNYPACKSITIINSSEFGTPAWTFVSLCRQENENGGYVRCELGKIYASEEKLP